MQLDQMMSKTKFDFLSHITEQRRLSNLAYAGEDNFPRLGMNAELCARVCQRNARQDVALFHQCKDGSGFKAVMGGLNL